MRLTTKKLAIKVENEQDYASSLLKNTISFKVLLPLTH